MSFPTNLIVSYRPPPPLAKPISSSTSKRLVDAPYFRPKKIRRSTDLDEILIFFSFEPAIVGLERGNPRLASGAASVHITVCYLKGCFLLCILNFILCLMWAFGEEIQSLLFFFHGCLLHLEESLLGLSQYLKCNQSDYQIYPLFSIVWWENLSSLPTDLPCLSF
jgi:hypothetical protein